jgi:ABC-type phosphate/phosphonate transport system ATPase subunit
MLLLHVNWLLKRKIMETKFINHGHREMAEESNWEINQGDIIVTVGNLGNGGPTDQIRHLSIQVNSSAGPIIQTAEDTESGKTITIKSEKRIVVCTVIKVSFSDRTASLMVTENRVE